MQVICSILNDQTDVKFADDTYLVIPAASADTRVAELGHIAAWTADNNLRLNKSKTREVVFYDNRRRNRIQPPPPLPDIIRDSTLKVLGVTFTRTLSASDHVRSVSAAVRSLSMHCECCGITVLARMVSGRFSGQSLSLV